MKGGRLRIINESRYPDEEVRALVRFGLQEIDVTGEGLVAVVKDMRRSRTGQTLSGTAYSLYWSIPSTLYDKYLTGRRDVHLIVMRITSPEQFPIKPYRSLGQTLDYRSWQEALVGITAHEGCHIQHAHDGSYTERTLVERRHPIHGTIRVKRRIGDQRIEPRCEAFEAGMLRRFREVASGDGLPAAGDPATVRLANGDGEEDGARAKEVA